MNPGSPQARNADSLSAVSPTGSRQGPAWQLDFGVSLVLGAWILELLQLEVHGEGRGEVFVPPNLPFAAHFRLETPRFVG
jgi:hypothetical protein